MSNIKTGDRIKVKSSGNVGIVVARETTPLDGKKIKAEYVVKFGNGFDNYKSYSRHDIEKVTTAKKEDTNTKVYPKVYNYEHKCADGRTLILVGVVDTAYDRFVLREFDEDENKVPSEIFRDYAEKIKTLSIGYAICHPSDSNDNKVGANIALGRAYRKPLSYMESIFKGEFSEDTVRAILSAKAKFIEENLDRFINRDRK